MLNNNIVIILYCELDVWTTKLQFLCVLVYVSVIDVVYCNYKCHHDTLCTFLFVFVLCHCLSSD